MTTFDINIKKLNENATIPSYGSEFAAGADWSMQEAVLPVSVVLPLPTK